MNLQDYLSEVSIGNDPKKEAIFNQSLKQIFSNSFYNKIENSIKDHIEIKQDTKTDYKGAPAYYKGGNTIYTTNAFERESTEAQMRFLLHEFMHVLQTTKSFFIFNRFRELSKLSKRLRGILKKHLLKPIDVFLTGKNQGHRFKNKKFETVAYLINNSINWNVLSPKGQRLFVEELRRSGLFNLSGPAWKKRLP
tara:strand:- start:1173 stop:1754 length:582 start_codon:yes stop_codon:yes gene_type:complete